MNNKPPLAMEVSKVSYQMERMIEFKSTLTTKELQ